MGILPYYEKPRQYYELLNYFKKNFFEGNAENAEDLCEEIILECRDDFSIKVVFDLFDYFDINFEDEKQVNEVLQMITELSNNVRLWENNGHTPEEIFKRFEKPNLKALPDENVGSKKKVGRNDPCPCGSGKKYKKCCLN